VSSTAPHQPHYYLDPGLRLLAGYDNTQLRRAFHRQQAAVI
jgi:hypothetical protein